MKEKVKINLLTISFLLLLFASDSMATGIGFSLSGGGGEAEWDATNWSHSGSDKDFDLDTDVKRRGVAFLLDTAVSKDRVFNYRLNLGWEKGEYRIDDIYNSVTPPAISGDFETDGWFMSHDFGFRIYNNRAFRIWLGPEVYLSRSRGELDSNKNFKIDFYSFGIGPVLGLNLNMAKTVTVAFKVGGLALRNWGELEDRSTGDDWDIDSNDEYVYSSVGVIFRYE